MGCEPVQYIEMHRESVSMDERNGSEFGPRGQDVIKVFSLSLIIENCRLSLTPKIKPYLLVFSKAGSIPALLM